MKLSCYLSGFVVPQREGKIGLVFPPRLSFGGRLLALWPELRMGRLLVCVGRPLLLICCSFAALLRCSFAPLFCPAGRAAEHKLALVSLFHYSLAPIWSAHTRWHLALSNWPPSGQWELASGELAKGEG